MEDKTNCDLNELLRLGEALNLRSELLGGRTVGAFLSETLLRIRDREGRSVALAPNRVQLEYERRRGRRNIVLKARQMGISTWVAGQLFLKTVTRPGTMTVQVAHTHDSAEAIFRIVHRFVDCLPEGLKTGALRTSRASARQIVFPALDSEYRVESAGDRNAGRGATIQNLHCSEVARWPGDPAETLGGLLAAMPDGGELILESTPNGSSGCFYEEWVKAGAVDGAGGGAGADAKDTQDAIGMVRHFFPWWWEESYTAPAVAEASLTDGELEWLARQGMGGGAAGRRRVGFRRSLRERFGELAAQEYAEDADACFLSSGSCIFDARALEERLQELGGPFESRRGGELLVWFPPVAGREYLLAVDPAGGGSEGDFSAAQLLDMKTGLQCAELQGKLGTLELAQQAAALGREYNGALVAVERNNHGSGVLAYLNAVCKYPRIYKQGGKFGGQLARQDGWLTSSLSRPGMLGALGAALVESPELFQSRRLLRECRSFVRLRSGKTGAQAGSHDDCVMAMALGLSVRREILEDGDPPGLTAGRTAAPGGDGAAML